MTSTLAQTTKIQIRAGLSGYIAELSSAMLGAELGLPVAHLDNHASYIDHWLQLLKKDDRAILTAAARAEAASSLLLQLGGRKVDGNDSGDANDDDHGHDHRGDDERGDAVLAA